MTENPLPENRHGLQLRSEVTADGQVKLSLARVPVPTPGPDQILVRMQAAPINPSDLGLLFARADPSTAEVQGSGVDAVVTVEVPAGQRAALAARVGQAMTVGNEGAGEVIAAGDGAEALVGRTVAILGGSMYAEYRVVDAASALPLPAGATATEGASAFVNPLTSLGMVGTLRRDGGTALVHTAAASNLGQMLIKVCQADGIGLVNVVRRPEQVQLLRGIGAQHVVDSSAPDFTDALADAVAATGATVGFDALGGGPLTGQILVAMEKAASRDVAAYSTYGSAVHKQMYVYGGLDPRPLEIGGSIGFAWGISGWLLSPYLAEVGPAEMKTMITRVGAELSTTFASRFTAEISLAQVLQPEVIAGYGRPATGSKYLINPSLPT
ncbi:MAG: zinc-binding dehydrogenase [Propionibacteriaceae bacterium]